MIVMWILVRRAEGWKFYLLYKIEDLGQATFKAWPLYKILISNLICEKEDYHRKTKKNVERVNFCLPYFSHCYAFKIVW